MLKIKTNSCFHLSYIRKHQGSHCVVLVYNNFQNFWALISIKLKLYHCTC